MREINVTIGLPDVRPHRWPLRVRVLLWLTAKLISMRASRRVRDGEPIENVEAWIVTECNRVLPRPGDLVVMERG